MALFINEKADFFFKPYHPPHTHTHVKNTQAECDHSGNQGLTHTHTHMQSQLVSMLIFTMHINDHLSANKHTATICSNLMCVFGRISPLLLSLWSHRRKNIIFTA